MFGVTNSTILNYMEYLLIGTVFFITGYVFGQKTRLDPEVKKIVDSVLKPSPVGIVKRPTQDQILKRTDPTMKRIEEGKDAMRETLKHIKDAS